MFVHGLVRSTQTWEGSVWAYRKLHHTFPVTADDHPLVGPGHAAPPEDALLPSLDEVIEEDGVNDDVEDGELPRFEEGDEVGHDTVDEDAMNAAQASYNSWMKLVEECKQVKVKTLTFSEVIHSRKTADVMEGIAKIYG